MAKKACHVFASATQVGLTQALGQDGELTMRALLGFLAAMCISGCATTSQSLDSTNSAELAFAKVASPGGLPGSFDSLDGKSFEGHPLTIRVPSGVHVIEYSCPNVLSVDLQASTKTSFVAGRRYLLECGANQPGVIRER